MKIPKHKRAELSPLGHWLLAYADENGTSLTEMANHAGLSSGALRYLVKEPSRIPSADTCLRLAAITGKAASEIFEMAGVDAPVGAERFNPVRLELTRIYDQLSPALRSVLVDTGRKLLEADSALD